MQDFIYDYYGIYPEFDNNLHFVYQNYHYQLNKIDMDELKLNTLIQLSKQVEFTLGKPTFEVIKNKYGAVISNGFVLFRYLDMEINIEELMVINQIVMNDQPIDIGVIRDKWVDKVEFISRRYMQLLDLHDPCFEQYCIMTQYYLGLAESAIAYLVDLMHDHQSQLYNYLTHQRIFKFNYAELFHPLNFFEDNRVRDIAELYKLQFIQLEHIEFFIEQYHLQPIEIHYLMARILFPNHYFDLIEEDYFKEHHHQEEILKSYHKIELEMLRIKEVHLVLNKYYVLRPIPWLMKD